MTVAEIKLALMTLNTSELTNVIDAAKELKTFKSKAALTVGQDVFVVQKTKRTAGVIVKINTKKAHVSMRNIIYVVPFAMIEAA